jgi:type IV pilus assembly protein PilM
MFEKKLIVLDIGNKTTKIVYGSAGKKKIVVNSYDIIETPKDCIRDGAVLNAGMLAAALTEAFKKNRISRAGLVINVTGTAVITREIQIPLSTDKEIDQILEFEAQQYFPVDLDNYTIDFKVLENTTDSEGSYSRVLLAAAPNKQIDGYIELAQLLKCQLVAIDIPANCLIKGFSYKNTENSGTEGSYAVVDIGHETSMVCIFQNNYLKFNRILLNGSAEIDGYIANKYNLDYSRAELLKTSFRGFSQAQSETAAAGEAADIGDTIRGAMDNIISDISRFIDFYNSREGSNHVQRIFVCGGGSMLSGLTDYFSGYFNIPVSTLPLENEVIYKGKRAFDQDYIRLANAIGGLVRI